MSRPQELEVSHTLTCTTHMLSAPTGTQPLLIVRRVLSTHPGLLIDGTMTYIRVCVCVCVCACVYIRIYIICIYICTHVRTYVRTYVCT